MLDAEPGIVSPRFVRAADLQQHKVDRQTATGYQAADIGNIGRHDVVGAIGKKPPPGAGAAQCGDVGVVGGEAVAEGQREKHTRNGGQRSPRASSNPGRNTRSPVASAHPTVSPPPISRVKTNASGAMVTRVFHAALSEALSEEGENPRRSSGPT